MFGFVTSELRAGDPKVITDERTAGRVHHRAQIYGSFRKLGVPYFGVLIIRILLFRVLH